MSADLDLDLWHRVQRIVYPQRWPSNGAPFPIEVCSIHWRPASWLYWTLLGSPDLRRAFFA
jgi:hypothetical protein